MATRGFEMVGYAQKASLISQKIPPPPPPFLHSSFLFLVCAGKERMCRARGRCYGFFLEGEGGYGKRRLCAPVHNETERPAQPFFSSQTAKFNVAGAILKFR